MKPCDSPSIAGMLVMLCVVTGCILLLTGCTAAPTPEPVKVPVEVKVPVPVGCIPAALDPAPVYPDTKAALMAATDAASRYRLLYAGRKLRMARLNELEPIVMACPKAQ